MAQLVYFVVYLQVLFYISIGAGDVGFGLVVVVVRHEKFNAIVGKKLAHFVAELRRQRLVVRENKRRSPDVFDYVSHSKRLAAARHAQQYLRAQSVLYALRELRDCFRLVARRLIFGY